MLSERSHITDRSRRRFLALLAGFGVGAFLSARSSFGQQKPTGVRTPQLIDLHHHFFPPAFVAAALGKYRQREKTIVSEWTPEKALEEMDRRGVATAVLSITTPGIWFGDAQAARTLTRKCNEYAAQMVKDNPTRFGFFAAIPLPDAEGSLREIEYALDTLKADGVGLMTSYGDKWLGDPSFAAVLDQLNRRKALVYVHPTAANCCRDLMADVPTPLIEYPHDTTRAITNLLYSGSFARLRAIRFIFSHAGGTIPVLAGRISQLGTLFGSDKKVPNGVEFELKRLYYEIANSANHATMAALMSLVPASQIVFGTDYPFVPIEVTADGMRTLKLSTKDLQAIGRDNALALLPRLAIMKQGREGKEGEAIQRLTKRCSEPRTILRPRL
jgi:6-methylsalicylate decarboxylase